MKAKNSVFLKERCASIPWCFCRTIWVCMALYFMPYPFTQSNIFFACLAIFCSVSTYILCIKMMWWGHLNKIWNITYFQRKLQIIPDVHPYQLQAVQTRNIHRQPFSVGTFHFYEDPNFHALLFLCKGCNSSVCKKMVCLRKCTMQNQARCSISWE